MRPKSIRYFEGLFLTSAALNLFDIVRADFPDPEIGRAGSFLLLWVMAAFISWIWFGVARRAIPAAKLTFVVFIVAGTGLFLSSPSSFVTEDKVAFALTVTTSALDVAAAMLLFRHDARRWFANGGADEVDPQTFA